ncbi:unnamed protein product [Cochlearia groenlandica]
MKQSVAREAVPPKKKSTSLEKRARQAKKKVLEALEELKAQTDAQSDEIVTVEKLIGEAYSAIDKAVKVKSLHKNTGVRMRFTTVGMSQTPQQQRQHQKL